MRSKAQDLTEPAIRVEDIPTIMLQFKVGDDVEWLSKSGVWHLGTVVGRFYRDNSFPAGRVAPYNIVLHMPNPISPTWAVVYAPTLKWVRALEPTVDLAPVQLAPRLPALRFAVGDRVELGGL